MTLRRILKILGVLVSIATIIGVCISAIALIPSFGQWLGIRPPTQPTSQPIEISTEDIVSEPEIVQTELPQVPQEVQPETGVPLSCREANGTELLSEAWHLEGENGDDQEYEDIDPTALQGKDSLLIMYDLHGMQAIEGDLKDASAIIFDQPNWHVISLANYGTNGTDGRQTVTIPLTDFVGIPDVPAGVAGGTILDPNKPIGTLHTRFWYATSFVVDIYSICAYKVQP